MLYRWRLCNWIIEDGKGLTRADLKVNLMAQTPAGVRTANTIADFWIQRVLGRPMDTPANRAEVVNALKRGAASGDLTLTEQQVTERLPNAVEIILMSPEFQLR